MLVPFTSNNEKVVMGLLSYIEEFKDYELLTEEIQKIKDGKRHLYLWKDEETDNMVGLIGFDLDSDDDTIVIRYLSLNPSFREEGLSYDLLTGVRNEFPTFTITGSIKMAPLLNKWAHKRNITQELEALRDIDFDKE
ncbi:reductase [Aerococcus kribbianus]|uniref:Reductase n=1 Tax=Aerococcus kribbianus TaxID=2999064 RepID=A0A9X3JFI2_9LACT|nr:MULTISPECIES: reductase [unclassified Aerococcus]MCZ0717663.1 reductase [Aerococcus sp. YH-aer221]MCZ0725951.1 reductase [Aerococcus sp. YH-aer222]